MAVSELIRSMTEIITQPDAVGLTINVVEIHSAGGGGLDSILIAAVALLALSVIGRSR